MAYMLMQRLTTAVLEGYADADEVSGELDTARSYRRWLESLTIDPAIRGPLVEQATAIAEAFERLERR